MSWVRNFSSYHFRDMGKNVFVSHFSLLCGGGGAGGVGIGHFLKAEFFFIIFIMLEKVDFWGEIYGIFT
jgi:hypothetical protein